MLAACDTANDFLEAPPRQLAAEVLEEKQPALPALNAGQELDHYEVISLLGKGGMGEVYLARDRRLHRQVALKVLPALDTHDRARVRRFEQEAHAASALSHPNIAMIFDLGQAECGHFIAMEFVEGQTLRALLSEKLGSGQPGGAKLGLAAVLEIAAQIASALAAAHRAGVVHRDIKPENIMLRPDGYVKVLDFGLAKLTEARRADQLSGLTRSTGTAPGTVMGTISYMSPEQVRGQEVDARSDLFSLGVVLHEMISGETPFRGLTPSDVMANILRDAPPALAPMASPEMQQIVTQALEKDRDARYQTAGQLLQDLNRLKAATAPALTRQAPAKASGFLGLSGLRGLIGQIVLLLLALTGLGLGIFYWGPWRTQPQTPQQAAALTTKPATSYEGQEADPGFAPDGQQLAFVWDGGAGENRDIYVKPLNAETARRLTTDPALDYSPVWSPDGQTIAFLRQQVGREEVWLIPAQGGAARKLAELATHTAARTYMWNGLDWSPDGQWLAVVDSPPGATESLFLLGVETGEKRRLTFPSKAANGDIRPAFSPDGRWLAFARGTSSRVDNLFIVPVSGGEARQLSNNQGLMFDLAWLPGGETLAFTAIAEGKARLFLVAAAEGKPEPVAGIEGKPNDLAVARTAPLLVYSQRDQDSNLYRLNLKEPPRGVPAGQAAVKLLSSSYRDDGPQYSPDGRRLAFQSVRTGNWELWVADSDGQRLTQLTSFNGPETGGVSWSPDSRWLAFDSRPDGHADIFIINMESPGQSPRRLTRAPSSEILPAWSRDGQWLYFVSNRTGAQRLWKLPAFAPDAESQAVQVIPDGGYEAVEAPDGQTLYFTKFNGSSFFARPVTGPLTSPVRPAPALRLAGFFHYWTAAAGGLYFIPRDPAPQPFLYFFDFQTQQATQVAALRGVKLNHLVGLSVSPDGRWLLYSQVDRNSGDLTLVENFR